MYRFAAPGRGDRRAAAGGLPVRRGGGRPAADGPGRRPPAGLGPGRAAQRRPGDDVATGFDVRGAVALWPAAMLACVRRCRRATWPPPPGCSGSTCRASPRRAHVAAPLLSGWGLVTSRGPPWRRPAWSARRRGAAAASAGPAGLPRPAAGLGGGRLVALLAAGGPGRRRGPRRSPTRWCCRCPGSPGCCRRPTATPTTRPCWWAWSLSPRWSSWARGPCPAARHGSGGPTPEPDAARHEDRHSRGAAGGGVDLAASPRRQSSPDGSRFLRMHMFGTTARASPLDRADGQGCNEDDGPASATEPPAASWMPAPAAEVASPSSRVALALAPRWNRRPEGSSTLTRLSPQRRV